MRILYIYGAPVDETLREITNGELPSDRMFGFIELKKYGYDIGFIDSKPRGFLKNILVKLNSRFGINIKELRTLRAVRKFDVIVVNDRFSTVLTLACRFFNKKIVYIDTLFYLPKNKYNKVLYKINLKLISGVVVYSKEQAKLWSKLYNIPIDKFVFIPYSIDVPFYKSDNSVKRTSRPFILSVGRDIARDYRTLVEAVDGLQVDLKVVSLPYLFKDVNCDHPWLEILEYISYEQLFQLYTEALFVVIPLKKWGIVYPAGIRGLTEAMALNKGVIVSYSPILEEYAGRGEGVLFFDAENASDLRKKILQLLHNKELLRELEKNVQGVVEEKYNMELFASKFGNYLTGLSARP